MVCGGLPSSQRNRFGAANHTWPVTVKGCVSDFNVRVCTKSADHVWMLVCALSHAESRTSSLAACPRAGAQNQPHSAKSMQKQIQGTAFLERNFVLKIRTGINDLAVERVTLSAR